MNDSSQFYFSRARPAAAALLAPERTPLSYAALGRHVEKIAEELRAIGLSRESRVAVLLPNGAVMVTAILSVMSVSACAPMNPSYSAGEFARYFTDLLPDAVLTIAGFAPTAREAALACGTPIIELAPDTEAAGIFALSAPSTVTPTRSRGGDADVALLLFTSGTTDHPKIVPLTYANSRLGRQRDQGAEAR